MWRIECGSAIYGSPFVFDDIDSDEGCRVVCVSCDGVVFVVRASDGQKLLEKDCFDMKGSCFSSPIVYDERVYVGCRNNMIYSMRFVHDCELSC